MLLLNTLALVSLWVFSTLYLSRDANRLYSCYQALDVATSTGCIPEPRALLTSISDSKCRDVDAGTAVTAIAYIGLRWVLCTRPRPVAGPRRPSSTPRFLSSPCRWPSSWSDSCSPGRCAAIVKKQVGAAGSPVPPALWCRTSQSSTASSGEAWEFKFCTFWSRRIHRHASLRYTKAEGGKRDI